MKKISVLLALVALFFVDAVFANAVATTVTGTAQVIRGTSPARAIRQGDELNQGDTVFTGPNSSIVMKFDDGQVAALTANSRMTITAYQYNPQQQTGNVLLSLIDGGMRAITGLIGKNTPDRVTYRAATATIGIRGTTIDALLRQGDLLTTVHLGSISVRFESEPPVILTQGNSLLKLFNRPFQTFPTPQLTRFIPPHFQTDISGLNGLQNAINQSAPGQPRSGTTGQPPSDSRGSSGPQSGGPTGGGAGGGGTGNTASPS